MSFSHVIVTGVVATVFMDLWGYFRKPLLGLPAADYRLVGRWVGHLARGRFRHESITASMPVSGEGVIGWVAHYLLGLVFAAALLLIVGERMDDLTWPAALAFGLLTVAAPTLVMQPAMGMRVALRAQSVLTHAFFGLGLWLGARVAAGLV